MSVLAALDFAWAAVHAFVGLFNCALYMRLRWGREYLAFAGASIGSAVYCVGIGILLGARDDAAAADAQQLRLLSVSFTVGALASLLRHMTGRPRLRLLRATWFWSGLGVAATLAGLFVDPSRSSYAQQTELLVSPQSHQAAWTSATPVYTVVAILLVLTCLADAARSPERRRDMPLLGLVLAPAALAALHDWVVRFTPLQSVYLLDHVSVLTSMGISYVLLRRYVGASEELTRRTVELRGSYDELHAVQEELIRKEQLAAVGELSAVIAHEVQHPLHALERAVDRLGAERLSEAELANLLGILDEETDRLNRLVRDLLVYARPVEPQYEVLDLPRIWARAVDAARREHPRSDDVEVNADLQHAGSVFGDPDLVERAFANLVENAFEAMPNGGVLTVRASDGDLEGAPALELAVDDTGEGMDTLVRQRAREPFFTTRHSGTGLGLAIVERVVRAHGGRVQLDQNVDGGTTVKLLIPRDRRSSLPPAP